MLEISWSIYHSWSTESKWHTFSNAILIITLWPIVCEWYSDSPPCGFSHILWITESGWSDLPKTYPNIALWTVCECNFSFFWKAMTLHFYDQQGVSDITQCSIPSSYLWLIASEWHCNFSKLYSNHITCMTSSKWVINNYIHISYVWCFWNHWFHDTYFPTGSE